MRTLGASGTARPHFHISFFPRPEKSIYQTLTKRETMIGLSGMSYAFNCCVRFRVGSFFGQRVTGSADRDH
jgi:hypothetical protein